MAKKRRMSKLEAARLGLLELEAKRPGSSELAYARQVVAGLERLEAEREALRTLDLPAAFGGKPAPLTDAARAAHRQLEISRGKDVPSW